jgi:hypothetical protein
VCIHFFGGPCIYSITWTSQKPRRLLQDRFSLLSQRMTKWRDTLLNKLWSWAPWGAKGGGGCFRSQKGQTDRQQQQCDMHLEWTSYSKGYVTWVTNWAAAQSPLWHSEIFVCVTFIDTYMFYNTIQHVTSCSSSYNDMTLAIVIWFLLLIPQNIMLLT